MLAAGEGSRLAPLTTLRPKALCPVDNYALLDWALDRVTPHCGSVAVNVHHHKNQMVRHLKGRMVHLSIECPVALGTAGALGRLRHWVDGRPVLLTNADAWERDGAAATAALIDGWDAERPRLRCIVRRSTADFGDLTYVGSALLPWWSVKDLDEQPGGLYELSWQQLYAEGRLELVVLPGVPIDCGTPAAYLAANLTASGGRSVIGPGAIIEGEVVRSVVWPDSHVRRGERLIEAIRAGDLTVNVPAFPARGERHRCDSPVTMAASGSRDRGARWTSPTPSGPRR